MTTNVFAKRLRSATRRVGQATLSVWTLLQLVWIRQHPDLVVWECSASERYRTGERGMWVHPDAVAIARVGSGGQELYGCPHCDQVVPQDKVRRAGDRLYLCAKRLDEDELEEMRHARLAFAGLAGSAVIFLIHCLELQTRGILAQVATICFAMAIPLAIAAIGVAERCIFWKRTTYNAGHWRDLAWGASAILTVVGIVTVVANASALAAAAFVAAIVVAMMAYESVFEETERLKADFTEESSRMEGGSVSELREGNFTIFAYAPVSEGGADPDQGSPQKTEEIVR